MPNLPFCHWSSQLFDLRAQSSTDVPVLLINCSSEFTQQDGSKKDGKTLVCDKRDRAITCVFCLDFHLKLKFCGL